MKGAIKSSVFSHNQYQDQLYWPAVFTHTVQGNWLQFSVAHNIWNKHVAVLDIKQAFFCQLHVKWVFNVL